MAGNGNTQVKLKLYSSLSFSCNNFRAAAQYAPDETFHVTSHIF